MSKREDYFKLMSQNKDSLLSDIAIVNKSKDANNYDKVRKEKID